MPYDLALEYEQEQREAQGQIAQEQFDDQNAQKYDALEAAMNTALRASGRFGKGLLCKCGFKCAEDCDCHLF